jgi:hypothetical protein
MGIVSGYTIPLSLIILLLTSKHPLNSNPLKAHIMYYERKFEDGRYWSKYGPNAPWVRMSKKDTIQLLVDKLMEAGFYP